MPTIGEMNGDDDVGVLATTPSPKEPEVHVVAKENYKELYEKLQERLKRRADGAVACLIIMAALQEFTKNMKTASPVVNLLDALYNTLAQMSFVSPLYTDKDKE